MPGPIVEAGDEVTLRTVEREDAAFLQRFYADPWARVGVHADGHKNEAEVEEAIEEEFEDDANAVYLACVDDPDAPYGHPDEDETTPVAFVFVSHVDRDRPGIVHWVAPEFRGEGYGEAALELVVDTLFRTYDAHSLTAAVLDGDDARERFEALGFVHEGANREMHFVEGEYRDAHQYGLLRREWEGE
ncbi:GNAT family N-acetyltransferase [Halostella sp. JP-L12]|uniref:GNAT family N-acetyltransferase n=1 Tax=Halostella TaxID=1843185 RepID=UPI000EF78171|nr:MULTISPECIES: GNAT family protein [Halostella]NHN47720.1 GNAT family N-acetyltransferase [Halostella sp. JP-L12]